MNPPRYRFLAAVLALGTAGTCAAAADSTATGTWLKNLNVSTAATTSWVENASRTSFAPTRDNAEILEFNVTASQHRQVARDWLLTATLAGDYVLEPEYDRCSFVTVGPRLELQRKFGLGPLAPVLQIDATYSYKDARIHNDSGGTAEASIRLAKRLTSQLRVAAGVQWLEHYARSATFDIQQRTSFIEASWDFSERWRLSGSAGWLRGRVVAGAAPSVWPLALSGALGATVFNYYNKIPWEVSDAYDPGWVSYNVWAKANLWSVGLAYAVSDRTSVELRDSTAYVINRINVRYPTDSWGLSVVHRF
jgi:hypothetical protein